MNKYLLKQFKDKAVDIGIDLKTILIDEIQAFFLEEFYKNPSSNGTVLVGGGRFRHINNSLRFSVDLDFFQDKGFNEKNIQGFISGKFIKLLEQRFGVSARIIETPPWQKTHNIETIRLLVYDKDNDFYQIEIDFDFIMRKPYSGYEKELFRNVVILTSTNEESLEEKLISVFEREPIKIRDLFDFWYYRDLVKKFDKDRIQKKLKERGVSKDSIEKRLKDFTLHRDYYIREIKNIIKSCGEKRQEVENLLKLDMDTILDYVITAAKEYL